VTDPEYTESLNKLIEEFGRLPRVSPKTAERLAFYILRTGTDEAMGLAEVIGGLKENIRLI